MLVIDASTCVHALLASNGWAPIGQERLAAPPLMWSETLSTLRELSWRGVVSIPNAEAALGALAEAPVERLSPPGLASEAWQVAVALGWAKTYDAEYVALARILGARLLTLDARLRRGAGRMVDVIGPTEL